MNLLVSTWLFSAPDTARSVVLISADSAGTSGSLFAFSKRQVKLIRNICIVIAFEFLCSGCLFRLEHNTTTPGARGVVLDAQTRAPLASAQVIVSRLYGLQPPAASDALTNTRPPKVTTGKNGRFSVRPEQHWDVVPCLTERYRTPGGTLVIQRAGYEPATVQIWGDIMPLSAHPTNFIEVLLNPATK